MKWFFIYSVILSILAIFVRFVYHLLREINKKPSWKNIDGLTICLSAYP
jgi:hypothetical protein